MILGNLLHSFKESVVLSAKADAAPELMLDSAAKSGLVSLKGATGPPFSVTWLEKDMQLMLDSAAELNAPVPLTSPSCQMYRAAIGKGYGEGDICSSIRL